MQGSGLLSLQQLSTSSSSATWRGLGHLLQETESWSAAPHYLVIFITWGEWSRQNNLIVCGSYAWKLIFAFRASAVHYFTDCSFLKIKPVTTATQANSERHSWSKASHMNTLVTAQSSLFLTMVLYKSGFLFFLILAFLLFSLSFIYLFIYEIMIGLWVFFLLF